MTHRMIWAAILLALAVPAAAQQDDSRTERVAFAAGTTSATVEGKVTGYGTVSYLLGARAGQAANVSMAVDNPSAYFNIIAPGADTALFIGSISGNQFEGVLPADGDYTIEVYLMRNAARRDETATYRLEMIVDGAAATRPQQRRAAIASPEDGGPRRLVVSGVSSALNMRQEASTEAAVVDRLPVGTLLDNLGCTQAAGRSWCYVQRVGGGPVGYVAAEFLRGATGPDGGVATGSDDSALRAGQGDFDATGTLPCAQYVGQPMGQCAFGVARAGGGYATVMVTHPDGTQRALFFRGGVPTGADTAQADYSGPFSATKEADLNLLRVGQERYEVVDAVVLGG